MDLKVIVQSCTLTRPGNFFLLVQMDELQYARKERKSQKFRSEVQFSSSNPQFKKNVFQFSALSYGDRLTLKLGCFNTRLLSEPNENKTLMDHSILHGSMQLVLTVKLLETLRIEGQLQHESLLYSPDDGTSESGRVRILLRHRSHDLKAQVEDDVERLQQFYFDPFETDEDVIRKKLQKVQLKLVDVQTQLEPLQKKANFMRTAHKTVSYELAGLRKFKEDLEEENRGLAKLVDKKNDVKELHIHIDLLHGTDQGQGLLKKKLVLLMNKLEFERKLYHELSNHYYQIEGAHTAAKSKASELQTIKDTINEQDFLIKRYEDQMPLLNNQKETIENQEAIIVHLQNGIKEASGNFTKLDRQNLFYELDKLRNERELLKQKQIQLQAVTDMNKGERLPRTFFEQFKNDEFFKDNPIIVEKFKKRADMLLKELELLQDKLVEVKNAPTTFRPQTAETSILQLEIQQAENKSEILQEQMLSIAKNYAKQIADLKAQLNVIEAQLKQK